MAHTNTLLLLILTNLSNGTLTAATLPSSLTPPAGIVRQNCFLFASLFTSLLAAAGAVLAKQWLANYEKTGQTGPLDEQGLRRTAKFRGAEKWQLQRVVEGLPTLILISLGLFFVAITDYIWTLNQDVAALVMAFSVVGTSLYIAMLLLASIYPLCPFQTAPSLGLRSIWWYFPEFSHQILVALAKYAAILPLINILDCLTTVLGQGTSRNEDVGNSAYDMGAKQRIPRHSSHDRATKTNRWTMGGRRSPTRAGT